MRLMQPVRVLVLAVTSLLSAPTEKRSTTLNGDAFSSRRVAASTIEGHWEWKLDIGVSSGKVKMQVAIKNGRPVAVVTAPDGTKMEPKDFVFRDDKVSFVVERKRGFVTVKLSHAGVLKGDEISGTYSAQGGPIKKTGKWQATRLKE